MAMSVTWSRSQMASKAKGTCGTTAAHKPESWKNQGNKRVKLGVDLFKEQ
jgi:hypothetical protein